MKVTVKFHDLVALLPWKELLVITKQEAGLFPEMVWLLWGTEKSFLHAVN